MEGGVNCRVDHPARSWLPQADESKSELQKGRKSYIFTYAGMCPSQRPDIGLDALEYYEVHGCDEKTFPFPVLLSFAA